MYSLFSVNYCNHEHRSLIIITANRTTHRTQMMQCVWKTRLVFGATNLSLFATLVFILNLSVIWHQFLQIQTHQTKLNCIITIPMRGKTILRKRDENTFKSHTEAWQVEHRRGRKSKGLFATILSYSYHILIIWKYISTTQHLCLSPACFGHVFMEDSTRPHAAQLIKQSVSITRRYTAKHSAMQNGTFWHFPARIAAEVKKKNWCWL